MLSTGEAEPPRSQILWGYRDQASSAPAAELLDRRRELVERSPFRCLRVLHDETFFTFAGGGEVKGTNLRWQLELAQHQPRLTLVDQRRVVAALAPWRDGAWKGHWRAGVNKPVLLLPHPPAVAESSRPASIKIFGLQRSGTNYLQWLLEHNFTNLEVLVDQTGWKHGPVPARIDWSGKDWHDPAWTPRQATAFVLHRLARLGPAGIARLERDFATPSFIYVFIVKNPYAWCCSYTRFLRRPLLPIRPEIVRLWCERHHHWLAFAEEQAHRSLFIAYEDLLTHPATVLAPLQQLGLERRPEPWRDVRRAMTPLGVPSCKAFDRDHYLQRDYLRRYDPTHLARLRRLLSPALLRRLGYDREGGRLRRLLDPTSNDSKGTRNV